MLAKTCARSALIATVLCPALLAGQSSRVPPATEAGLILRQIDGVKRVLMVAAHPDDEDTALLAALSRGLGVETAYFSLTRGEGGQNLIGPELGEGLGIIRSGELLAARAIDGAGQFFSRAYDFGYSKTAEETFLQWPRDLLLSDLVWVIRSFRPQVIITVFSGTPRDGHGQHQAAGILTREAWDAAGDPTRFPEQLAVGERPWTPLKLYRRTFFDPESATLEVETGALDPLIGRSHHQIAMESRSRHRSQDFGSAQAPGPRSSHLSLLDTRVPSADNDPILAGLDTTLVALVDGRGTGAAEAVRSYRAELERAGRSLSAPRPAASLDALARAAAHLDALAALLPEQGAEEAVREIERRRSLLHRATLAVAGVRIETRSRDDIVVPGQTFLVEIRVWSAGDEELTVDPPRILVPTGWGVAQLEPDVEVAPEEGGAFGRFFQSEETIAAPGVVQRLPPGTISVWRFDVSVPADAPPTQPYFLNQPRDGSLYRWGDDPRTRGLPFQGPVIRATVALDIGGAVGVETEEPVRYRGVDKASGEFWRPVYVAPRVAVAPTPSTLVWPVVDGGPRDVAFRIRNYDSGAVNGALDLEVPDGWEARPKTRSFALDGEGAEATIAFTVSPPGTATEGEFSLRPIVRTEAGIERGHAVTVIDYPHIEPHLVISDAAVRTIRFPVGVAERLIGYVMGSGDEGPESIRQLGLDVEMIEPDDWQADRLDRYDTIVLGVRAYEVRKDLITANPMLLDWVGRGGTVVVQYNKYEFNDGEYAPFPIEIGSPQARVTDEASEVRLLDPGAALFVAPNPIGSADFEGWVQERGLYFPTRWSAEYRALIGTADPGETELTGSILVAPFREGLYVHTSLSFFRQLPAGVPGAYRLWANLLSIDSRRWRDAGTP